MPLSLQNYWEILFRNRALFWWVDTAASLVRGRQEYLSKMYHLYNLFNCRFFCLFSFFKQNLRSNLLASYHVKRGFFFSHSSASYTHTQKHTHFFSQLQHNFCLDQNLVFTLLQVRQSGCGDEPPSSLFSTEDFLPQLLEDLSLLTACLGTNSASESCLIHGQDPFPGHLSFNDCSPWR